MRCFYVVWQACAQEIPVQVVGGLALFGYVKFVMNKYSMVWVEGGVHEFYASTRSIYTIVMLVGWLVSMSSKYFYFFNKDDWAGKGFENSSKRSIG